MNGYQTREQTAVAKASRARLLADMRAAARLVHAARFDGGFSFNPTWTRGYILGACEYASATRRACLLTAFGA